jgi:hypothetical protein
LNGKAKLNIQFRGDEFADVSVVDSELDELQAFGCFTSAVKSWPFSVRTGSAVVPIRMKGKR